jgi:hypothetical protein
MAQILLRDLSPGTTYNVQVRAVSDTATSEWSPLFSFTTVGDTLAPAPPTSLSWTVVGTAFAGTWTAPTTNSDGSALKDFKDYQVTLTANSISVVVYTTEPRYDLSFEQNKNFFGTAQATVQISVKARDISGNLSTAVTTSATNPAPAQPANFTATGLNESIGLKWDAIADTDLDHYEVYMGTTVGFTADASTLKYSGLSTGTTIVTAADYAQKYFKLCSVDVFGSKSTFATANATPTSSFVVDVTAPAQPTSLAVTGAVDTADPTGSNIIANVTWSQTSVSDLAGFTIRYRKTGVTEWSLFEVNDGSLRAAKIPGLSPGTGYDFQIKSYDFSGNTAGFTATVTMSAVTDTSAPSAPSSVTASAGLTSVIVSWAENTEVDVKNGAGTYEVQIATNSGFTTGVQTNKTTATVASFIGLTAGTTYWARVRAIDSSGNASAYTNSTPSSVAAGSPPSGSDGSPPASSPTPTVLSGLGSLYVTWTPVTNADIVTYEVHMSTTTGFTPSGATKVMEVAGSLANLKYDASGAALVYGTTYFVKLIAKDKDGSAAAGSQGSGTIAKVTAGDINTISGTQVHDGSAPSSSPTPTVKTGLGYLFVYWTGVTNNDPVTYEVHISTTTGFTPSGTTKVFETSDTSAIIRTADSSGTLLSYGTTYFVKLIAKDADGSAAAGTQGSGSISQVAAADIVANTITASQIASNTITASQIAANTITASQIAANTITASQIAANTITASQIAANTITAGQIAANTITSSQIAAGTITATQIQAGSITGDRLTANTITATQIASATITSAQINMTNFYATAGTVTNTLTIGASGIIQSTNYVAASTGWQLSQNGLEINGGTIRAAALLLQAGENILPPEYADFEFQSTFYTSSVFVTANSPTLTIDLTKQRFNAQALKIVAGGSIPTIDFTTGSTTYNIPMEGSVTYIVSMYVQHASGSSQNINIRFKDSATAVQTSANQSVPTGTAWTRVSATFTTNSAATSGWIGVQIPASQTFYIDGVQVEKQTSAATTPSAWMPPSTTSINGGMIKTGSIQSTATTSFGQSSGTQPMWSISLTGSAVFSNALIRGHLIVGDSGSSGLLTDQYIASANYVAGTSGYIIKGDGNVEFNNGTFRGTITATAGAIGGFSIGSTTITGGSSLVLDSTGTGIITGGTLRTAASGTRIELTGAAYDTIGFYTGSADETTKGFANVFTTGTAGTTIQGVTAIGSPAMGGQATSYIRLYSTSKNGTLPARIVTLGRLEVGELVTQIGLRTFPQWATTTQVIQNRGLESWTTSSSLANQTRVVNHGLGATPTTVVASIRGSNSGRGIVSVDTVGSTSFTINYRRSDNTNIASGVTLDVDWFAST